MFKKPIAISLPIFIFLMVVSVRVIGQSAVPDHILGNIADIEKKSFGTNAANRMAGGQNLARTAASENFDVNFYRCEWDVDPAVRFITGKVTSYFTMTIAGDKITYDLSDTLKVDSITYHGIPLNFQRISNDGLQLTFPSVLNAGQKDSVSIYYNGVPRNFASYKPFVQSAHSGVPIIWTLSEPFGAKEWWPCKNGLNDKADSIDILIKNPAGYQASSNGLMVQESIIGGTKLSIWKHRYPISSYLVAMAVTNFAVLKDTVLSGGKVIELIDYVYPENSNVFNSQRFIAKAAINLFGKFFGDYPYAKEKYGFTQFGAGGGMEHQTNSFINYPTVQLLEHETAHQWFGDKVTCGSWQDIWLNEGFATYCQVLFNQYIDTANYYPILKNMTHDLTTVPDGSVWVSDTTNPERIFNTYLTYYKGAWLLHMLRWKLGDDIFFRAIKNYLNDQTLQYNFAKTSDLKRHLETESGQDLTSFFKKWFYGEGFPSYNCTWSQNKNNWASVQINQTTSHSSVSFYDMPVQVRFMNGSRDTLITLNHHHSGETFWVNPGFVVDSMAVDPYYWILAKTRIVQKIPAKSSVQDDISIYPNPASNNINILIANPTAAKLTILLYNTSGQLVYKSEKTLAGNDELISIPVNQLARGLYILRISNNNGFNVRKTIVR
ncbi:MAG: M1 family aminopeptidase [Chitinophagaceae bacterium]